MRYAVLVWAIGLSLSGHVVVAEEPAVTDQQLHDTIERGLAVVTRGAKNYPQQRQCFSCHHQTLPLLALSHAEAAGVETDRAVFTEQLAFTQRFFRSRAAALARGERIGGAAATVAYGLWTYEIAERRPDDVSDALVANLIKLQASDGHWQPPSVRPPLEESTLSLTVLAASGLLNLARGERQPAADAALDKAHRWLAEAQPISTEEHVFLLLWQTRYAPSAERAKPLAQALEKLQHDDGGWSQTPEMASDAYATGQALTALAEYHTRECSAAIERGIAYLRTTQQADGSWHVKTRSKPVQKYFDNGDPHGKDQFISIAATSWATAGLARATLGRKERSR